MEQIHLLLYDLAVLNNATLKVLNFAGIKFFAFFANLIKIREI